MRFKETPLLFNLILLHQKISVFKKMKDITETERWSTLMNESFLFIFFRMAIVLLYWQLVGRTKSLQQITEKTV
jgi:hypothetical protein